MTFVGQMNNGVRLASHSTGNLIEERYVFAHAGQLHDLAKLNLAPPSADWAGLQRGQ